MQSQTVFVRWSDGHCGDIGRTSINYQSGCSEPGLSVMNIQSESDYDIYTAIAEYQFIGHPVCYLCTGEIAGEGNDGEPCLDPDSVQFIGFVDESMMLSITGRKIIQIRSWVKEEKEKKDEHISNDWLALWIDQVSKMETGTDWYDVKGYNIYDYR